MGFRNIGTISRAYGTQGQIILSDCPDASLKLVPGSEVIIGFSAAFGKPYTILTCESYKQTLVLSLKGITTNDIPALADNGVFIDESLLLRGDEQYFISDLLGCTVINEQGIVQGEIIDVWIMPANDVWVMKTPEGEIPLPVIDEVIKKTDITSKTITIHMMDGLADLAKQSEQNHEEY